MNSTQETKAWGERPGSETMIILYSSTKLTPKGNRIVAQKLKIECVDFSWDSGHIYEGKTILQEEGIPGIVRP